MKAVVKQALRRLFLLDAVPSWVPRHGGVIVLRILIVGILLSAVGFGLAALGDSLHSIEWIAENPGWANALLVIGAVMLVAGCLVEFGLFVALTVLIILGKL